jgi:hypothetical protein
VVGGVNSSERRFPGLFRGEGATDTSCCPGIDANDTSCARDPCNWPVLVAVVPVAEDSARRGVKEGLLLVGRGVLRKNRDTNKYASCSGKGSVARSYHIVSHSKKGELTTISRVRPRRTEDAAMKAPHPGPLPHWWPVPVQTTSMSQ